MTEKFNRYRQEHSRLHDPEVLQSSAELVPVALEQVVQAASATGQSGKRRNKRFLPAETSGIQRLLALDRWQTFWGEVNKPGLSDPTCHESLTAYLLWLRAVTARAVAPATEAGSDQAASPRKEVPPNVRLTPWAVAGPVELFHKHEFTVDAPGARRVEMVWRESNAGVSDRVIMDHQSADHFNTNIGIEDGEYIFGYNVDGSMRPDHRYAPRVVLRSDGVWGRLKLSRHERLLAVKNRGKTEEFLRIESSVPWLMPFETELRLPPLASALVGVRLLPHQMVLGANEGSVQVYASREGKELLAASAAIEVVAEAAGSVPEFKYAPREFGWIMQGQDELRLDVEVSARGSGRLAGMVMLRHSREIADFRLDNVSDQPRFLHTFVIDSANLPHLAQGKLRITFVTDSYLANYRFSEAELPYGLIYLKKSLPALGYGRVRKGATRTLRLDVARSDGKALDLEALIPAQASSYLEAYRAGPGAFSFRFDSRELAPETIISEVITLHDRSSGLSDQLKVLAEVSSYQARGESTASAVSKHH